MARKDVDLVIRAKDEAAKVVDTITRALNEFVEAQATLDTRAKKTESSLGQLGAALGDLQKTLGSLSIGDQISASLDRAAAAIARIEVEAEGTQQELAKLSREMERQAAITDRYSAKLVGAKAALDRQKVAVARAKTEQRELAQASEQAANAQAKAAARRAALSALIDKQSEAVRKAAARYEELAREMEVTAEPSKALTRSLESAAKAVARQEAALKGLREEYAVVSGRVRAAGSAAAIFGAQAAAAANNLARQERALDKIAANYADLTVRSRSAVKQQNDIASVAERVERTLARQSAQLEKAESDYVDLAQAAGQADRALEQLARQSLGSLKTDLDLQRRAMLEAKREYLALTDASTKLATEIGRAGVPTREMAQAFAETKAQASAAKTVYIEKRQALELMGRAYREAGTDIASLQAAQGRFAAIQGQTRGVVDRTNAALKAQVADITRLHAESTRSVGQMERVATASRNNAAASSQAASATSRLAQAYRQFYGGSRQALSLMQRLRGEVLSLIAAYGGLFGVIELLNQTVQAYQTLEAAQARLNVANEGSIARSAADLDFLRRTAARLGIDLGTLAREYSKFALATQGTNLQGANARKIFLAVAEAARVNRTSNEQLSGVFVALTQIVSKGAVQMEELRQQLGDRLPGALQIMADGLGVTTAELIKMLEAGKVTSDALVPFAEELNRRFGPGLAEALAGTTTALGRLQNAAFQALVQFGEDGFIDAFTRLANDLTELLQSADFEAFVNRASAAFATLIDALAFLARNFELVVAAAAGFLGLKLAPFLILAAAKMGELAFQARAMAAATAATTGPLAGVGAAAGRAATGLGLFTAAARTLLSATGVGLIITGATALFGYLQAQADLATEALNTHRRIVDEVKNAYDALGGSAEDWRTGLESLTVTEAKRNLDNLVRALRSAQAEIRRVAFNDAQTGLQNFFGLGSFTGASQDYNRAVDAILETYRRGEIDARGLLAEIDKINQEFDDGSAANARYASQLNDAARNLVELEDAVVRAEAVLAVKTGTAEEATEAMEQLGVATEDYGQAMSQEATAATERFNAAMEELREVLPEVNSAMSEFEKTVQGIDASFEAALAAARAMPDAIMRIAAEQAALAAANGAMIAAAQKYADSNFGNFTSGTEAAAALLRDFEGFRSTPYWDVNAFRVGFGSDTVTLADGSVRRVVEGISVSVADANRDLIRRIETEFMPIAARAAGGRFATFTPQQQAALTSIAYNYGEIPDRVAKVLATGTVQEIADAIRSLAGDNAGVNRDRRFREAALFESTAGVEALAAEERRQAEEAQRRAEEEARRTREQRQRTQERIAEGEFEIQQQERINAGLEREAAIEEAIRQARAENPNITQAELDAIAEQTARLYDLEQAQKNVTTAKERAEEADRAVNQLLQQRQALESQLQAAVEGGNVAVQEELRAKLGDVNTQLLAAIENAKQMWAAVGGQEAATAIERLNAAVVEAENFGRAAQRNYLEWSRVSDLFVTGLAGAFDTFAQSVAEGKDIGEAARAAFLQFAADFLRQIAQMIIQQAIFNALQGAFGGTRFGSLIGLGHTGGIVGSRRVGSGNATRRVSPALFAGAPRYHEGGIIGLRPGEVPIIAKEGEAMLTEDDPYHPKNRAKLGGSAPTEIKTRIINAIDGSSFLAQALASEEGERVLLNWMRANSDTISSARG